MTKNCKKSRQISKRGKSEVSKTQHAMWVRLIKVFFFSFFLTKKFEFDAKSHKLT